MTIRSPKAGSHSGRPNRLYYSFAIAAVACLIVVSLNQGYEVHSILNGSYSRTSPTDDDSIFYTPSQRDKQRRDVENPIDEPLNIVLFYADDWTMNVLGKLNKDVHTPNIDRMADSGLLFSNNCVTTSICWISRGTMLTGTYASRHLFLKQVHDTLFHTHPWNATVFPLLKASGYFTGLVGKWHAPQPSDKMSMAFDYRRLYYGWHWMHRDGEKRHVTDLNLEDSLHFLRTRPMDQKFALKVSFFATHAWDGHSPPYEPKNETKDRYYNDVNIERPRTATEHHWRKMPPFFTERNEGRNRYRNRFDLENYQDSIRNLYRMATEVDFAVGEIIKELKDQGVYNKTLLIFTTDNGNMHGEHGLAEKWYPYEESIRVPLVIVDPRMHKSQHGSVNEEFTLSIDLAPTILGAAKIPPSDFMQGRDMADLYLKSKDNDVKWRQDWFYEYNQGHPITAAGHPGTGWIDASFALITKEWKYIYWPQQKYEQIFHRSVDPYEENDLIKSSEILPTSEIYLKLRSRYEFLKDWVQSGKPV